MEEPVLIDYAGHLIRIDALAKAAHDAAETQHYAQAVEAALSIIAEGRLLAHALVHMKNVEDERRRGGRAV